MGACETDDGTAGRAPLSASAAGGHKGEVVISEQIARQQLARLSVVHTQLNAAKMFDTFVDVLMRELRLDDSDVLDAVNELLVSTDDVRVTPGRLVDYAKRARAKRLQSARAARQEAPPGPSAVPYGDACGKCGGTRQVLVSERAVWCPACRTVKAERVGIDGMRTYEVDARVIDGEIRAAREEREQRVGVPAHQ